MVKFCCTYNCSGSSDLYPQLVFHSVPDEKQKEQRLKWIHAIKRKNFVPKEHTKLCNLHFKPSDYSPPVISGNIRFEPDAVPSIFHFPDDLQPKQVHERRPLVRVHIALNEPDENESNNDSPLPIEEPRYKKVAVQTNLTGDELDETLNSLRRDKDCLQQQLNRKNERITNMTTVTCKNKNEFNHTAM